MCQNIRWNPFKRWSEDGGGSHLEWSFKRGKINMIRGLVCQKQVSTAGTSNCIPQYMWGVITCPSPWYVLLAYNFSFVKAVPRKYSSVSKTFPLLELAWGAEAYPATPLTTTDVIIEKQGSTKPYPYLKTLVQVSREWLSDYIPHFSVGCNYLSLPQIHVLSPKSSFMGCTALLNGCQLIYLHLRYLSGRTGSLSVLISIWSRCRFGYAISGSGWECRTGSTPWKRTVRPLPGWCHWWERWRHLCLHRWKRPGSGCLRARYPCLEKNEESIYWEDEFMSWQGRPVIRRTENNLSLSL